MPDLDDVVSAAAGRIDTLAEALTELSGLLLEEESVTTTLQRVADLAVQTLPHCDGAGVTLIDGGSRYRTAVHTDPSVIVVDRAQYEAGDGPCLTAAQERRIVRVAVREAHERWPRFAREAERAGVLSFLAAPLLSKAGPTGSLNLYSRSPDGFDALDETLVALFVGQASVAVANARVYQSSRALTEQLQEAIESRAVIEQAKGVLMGRLGLSPDQAFSWLREHSQRRNVKLRSVALEVVAGVGAAPPPGADDDLAAAL